MHPFIMTKSEGEKAWSDRFHIQAKREVERKHTFASNHGELNEYDFRFLFNSMYNFRVSPT